MIWTVEITTTPVGASTSAFLYELYIIKIHAKILLLKLRKICKHGGLNPRPTNIAASSKPLELLNPYILTG
jgi:hypothetical protein